MFDAFQSAGTRLWISQTAFLALCVLSVIVCVGCEKSREELARDRFVEYLVDPIPDSVSELSFVNPPFPSKSTTTGIMFHFKIRPDDFERLLEQKKFERCEPEQLHHEHDLFRDADYLRLGDKDELYRSYRSKWDAYSTIKVNAEHTEVVFKSERPIAWVTTFENSVYRYDYSWGNGLVRIYQPDQIEEVTEKMELPEEHRRMVNGIRYTMGEVYRDITDESKPIVIVDLGWNRTKSDAIETHWSIPKAGNGDLVFLAPFAGLRGLSLSGSLVTDSGLRKLSDLSRLETLDLSGTGIGDQGLSHVAGLKSLRSLMLEETNITDDGLKFLEGLSNLEVLDLGKTKVTSQGLRSLASLTKLRSLNLDFAHVDESGLQHLKNLTQLEFLAYLGQSVSGLERNYSEESLSNLSGMTRMRVLELCGCKSTPRGLKALENMKQMECLKLHWAFLTDESLEPLSGMTELRMLDLADPLEGSHVSDAGILHLKKLKKLEKLEIEGFGVTEEGLKILESMTSMVELDLRRTNVGDGLYERLKNLTAMKRLDIAESKVTMEGVWKIKETLPDLSITHE